MKPLITSLLFVLGFGVPVVAQDIPPTHTALGYAYLGGGVLFISDQALYRQDVTLITSGSVLLADDLSDYDYYTYPSEAATGMFTAGMSIYPFRGGNASGPEVRLGVLYGGRTYSSGYFQRSVNTPYDTLTSGQTGEEFYLDSVHTRTYLVSHGAERLGVDVSAIWRTQGRWSIHGGAGLVGGVLFNVRTTVTYNESDGVSGTGDQPAPGPYPYYYGGSYYGYGSTQSTSETLQDPTGWWGALYIPVGLDLRLGRNGDFWPRAHLYYEIRPQLVFQGTSEMGTSTSAGIQSVFGVRFKL